MSYIINNSRGQIVAVVADGTTNSTATDLVLVGQAVTAFGEFQNENYVFLLENFANNTAPSQPILGQLWYNSSTDKISAYNTANAWVALASENYVEDAKISPAFSGIPTAPTPAVSTNTAQLATTAFVQNNKASPAFSGVPTAPTAVALTNTTQLATTAFVSNSPEFLGTPIAPTATYGTNNTQIATTAFVQGEKVSPAFSGTPTAPTAANGTSTVQVATTAFVTNTVNNLGTMSTQNASLVNISGGSIIGITDLAVEDGGTGASTAADARNNLGLDNMAVQNANAVAITGGTITGIFDLAIADGGTGASTAADARNNLGLASGATTTVGTMAVQNANSVAITGGTVTGITDLAVADGGTGASNAADARDNLGLKSGAVTIVGTMAVQNANAVAITGGTITGGTITGITDLAVADGGTGASTAADARNNLGLASGATTTVGTMAVQNASSVAITGGTITGGTITGITDLAVADGGTGASTAADARTNLGVPPVTRTITGTGGLTGGGDLSTNRTISIATDSNGYGIRYVSTLAPFIAGVSGDIWYQIR